MIELEETETGMLLKYLLKELRNKNKTSTIYKLLSLPYL